MRVNARHVVFMVACISVLTATCATPRSDGAVDYQGIFSHGFEEDAFTPCGSSEKWWASFPSDAIERYEALVQPYKPVLVRVRGRVSERGPSGHLGRYDRYLNVDSVLIMQPSSLTRC